MTRPAAEIEQTISATPYNYNYNYLAPLAMVDTVAPAEGFSARPMWLELVAVSALQILINAVVIGIRVEDGVEKYIERVFSELRAVASQLESEVEAKLVDAIDSTLHQQGIPTSLAKLEAFLKGIAENFGKDITEEVLGDLVQFILQLGTLSGRPASVTDYNKLFAFIPLPAVAQNFQQDTEFAAMRVAGPNPLMIARLNSFDARLPISEAQYQSVIGEDDTLAAALQQGRLYLADYGVFAGAVDGSFPDAQKFNYAPLALFAVPPKGKSLVAVAIQCAQQPGPDNPILTPQDGYAWLMAKTIVQIADGNFHEAVSHLGRTHLFVEPFVIATHNQLPPTHSLSVLLTPHFVGTLAINDAALTSLIAPEGGVDKLLSSTIEQSRVFAVKGALSYQLNVNSSSLPQTLAQRGVTDTSALPDYPYRDDALLLWGAINQWVTNYLSFCYSSDAAVQNDPDVQAWVAELVSHDGGRLNNVGSANEISTRDQLIELVTLICFTASAQHAAVNYPQGSIMSYTPAMPLAGYAPAPATSSATEADYLDLLPPLDLAALQLEVGYVLGSVYFTQLGQYGNDYFTDPVIQTYLAQFQQALRDIEGEIQRRNQTRTPYEFLLPSKIPQSINI